MLSDDRFEILDLQARYELEPSLKDVFVEGVFDKEVLGEGCITGVNTGRVYYEIDSVNVPNELVRDFGLTIGNKQRVITLAMALKDLSERSEYRCLVDRDLDEWFDAMLDVPRLRWTRYSCIETYFLDSELVHRYMVTVAKAKIRDWSVFFSSFVATLRELFALRLADRDLEYALTWLRLEKSLSVDRGAIRFDRAGYTKKLLQANKRASGQPGFDQSVSDWLGNLGDDHRNCARGHDFTFLMAWAIGEFGGLNGYASADSLERLLIITTHWPPTLVDIVA